MMDARFSLNMSFVSGVADSVGAYTLIRVTGPVAELRQRVRRCSEPPLPGSTILHANPTPCSLGSLEDFSCLKNV